MRGSDTAGREPYHLAGCCLSRCSLKSFAGHVFCVLCGVSVSLWVQFERGLVTDSQPWEDRGRTQILQKQRDDQVLLGGFSDIGGLNGPTSPSKLVVWSSVV